MDLDMTLTAAQRLLLTNKILPRESGSLKEAVRIKRLRDFINLNEGEMEVLDVDENGSFNPQKMDEIDEVEYTFNEREQEIVATSLIAMEEEGSVPTNDDFVEIVEKFGPAIKQVNEELDNE